MNLTKSDIEGLFLPPTWKQTASKMNYAKEDLEIVGQLDAKVEYPYYIKDGPLAGTKKYINGPQFRNVGELARFELDSTFGKDEHGKPVKYHFKSKDAVLSVAPEFMESYFAKTKNTDPGAISSVPLSIEHQDAESDDKVVIDLFLRSYTKAVNNETE